MSLLLLFVSFFFALYGVWVFFSGYTGGEKPSEDMAAAITGLAITVIPYIVAKTLSEMVAIRQRHLQLEQTAQFNYMVAEQMDVARQLAEEQMKNEPPSPSPAKTGPTQKNPAE